LTLYRWGMVVVAVGLAFIFGGWYEPRRTTMTDRYTRSLLSVIAIASTVLLTSCSNPDTSGGVTLSKGADDANEFPYGSCRGSGYQTHVTYATWCGWIKNYYILTGANLSGANLNLATFYHASLNGANLRNATDAYLQDVKVNSSTICPNGKSGYYCASNQSSGSDVVPPMPPMPPMHL